MSYRIGVDLGGTKLAAGIVGDDGSVTKIVTTFDHSQANEEYILDCIERNIDTVLCDAGLARGDIEGVGILFPGHISYPDGYALATSNLPGFKGFPLRARMEERLKLPVLADNDANGQTLGEYYFGAGAQCRNMVFLTVSSGIGGGIIIDGKLYRGMTGTAGEFGHMIIDMGSSHLCTCGNRGCLMAKASGLAIPQRARELASQLGQSAALPTACIDYDDLNGYTISQGCCEENTLCRTLVESFAHALGVGMYNIFQILNPECIVLGGGLMNLPDFFYENARATCYQLASTMMRDQMEIRKALLGAHAGIVGAGALFQQSLVSMNK